MTSSTLTYVCALQVSKDVDSGITHYVCIHIASEVTTKQARELDPTSPVALPKLPNSMGEIPTARSGFCCHCAHHHKVTAHTLNPAANPVVVYLGSYNAS